MSLIHNKPSIKSILLKNLMESEEPFFYLAPEIVGSINNAYSANKGKLFVIDFNTVDNVPMKMAVQHSSYSDWNSNPEKQGNVKSFLQDFLTDAKPCGSENEEGMIDEIVDEDGNLFGDTQDKPPNIKGYPGYGNVKSGQSTQKSHVARYTRMISPLGYGSVVW